MESLYSIENLEINRRESLGVDTFYERFRETLKLRLCDETIPLETRISEPVLQRPGLALAGFTDVYPYSRIQVLGSTDWAYIESMSSQRRKEVFNRLSRFPTPLWVITHNLPAHEEMLNLCREFKMPLMVTPLSTIRFLEQAKAQLESVFVSTANLHASLVDVYGIGMLYVGPSNIGKSECVLDLVERGHRLVADDLVRLTRKGNNIIGRSNHVVGHHMEVRGVGLIDVRSLFGIHAVRKLKQVEVVVELEAWKPGEDYQRTGLDDQKVEVMGVELPKIKIPVSPGKNITVISEVVAMDMLLKFNGVNTAKDFNERLIHLMSDPEKKRL
ncbi:HPr(Ser) kinase/phosphatase, partial [Fibrobacterales bacterium]|nr:HPr(Ser) kinase/phosphatase [Fibrobacterales bacterium]